MEKLRSERKGSGYEKRQGAFVGLGIALEIDFVNWLELVKTRDLPWMAETGTIRHYFPHHL